jgi:ATP/maltotriose-dependent transcriptional regulator MalT
VTGDELLAAGREAAERGAWEEAREAYAAAVAERETAEVVEGVALSSLWLWDPDRARGGYERAYRLYRRGGDARGAARSAFWLAVLAFNFRTDGAIGQGWLERGRRLLEGLEGAVPEQGMLAILGAHSALLAGHDLDEARRLSEVAEAVGRELGDPDVEMNGRALRGLVLVTQGAIPEGMRLLDEAAAAVVGGELTEPFAILNVPCYMIYACKRVRDYDRAAQWCDLTKELAERLGDRVTFAACRLHYADVLLWRGAWADVEHELESVTRDLTGLSPRKVADAAVRVGELRRRQGRPEEAEERFRQGEHHPLSTLGRAALAIDRGDPVRAVELVERLLRRLAADELTERVAGLELLVRALLAGGDAARAREAHEELRSIGELIGTEPLRASVAESQGLLAAAAGDHDAARRRLEDAVDLYEACGAPFEAAAARRELARALRALGRQDAADEELRTARRTLDRLGAALEREPPRDDGLTRREREVLRLVARGRSNQEIAAELVLSVRTVERHLSNIYDKIGASGTTARAAASTYAAGAGLS